MQRLFFTFLLLAACGSDQVLEHDLEPIALRRAPIEAGGAATGGLLAAVTTMAGVEPLLIDSAFPMNSLSRVGCVSGSAPGWTYTGTMELRDPLDARSPLRASFRSIGLFDICPGPTGDATIRPAGVMGGPLLANFVVGLVLPRDPETNASMSLWPSFPGTDDRLEQGGGQVVLHFDRRGGAPAGQSGGEASLTLPNSRIVLAACMAPRVFTISETQETCARGEASLKASGQDVMLAVGTGEGPLVLSEWAWQRVAAQLGIAPETGTPGELYTPFAIAPTPARYVDIPRLAILQGTTDSNWLGACAELARARRIEWVLANQAGGVEGEVSPCFQPCDGDNGHSVLSRSYLELGGSLRAAIVSDASEVIRSLNADVPPRPQVDGVIGAGTLAGTRIHLDYLNEPSARVIASCEAGSTRDTCWAAPSCPGFTDKGKKDYHCFGLTDLQAAPVCE